MDSSQDYRLLLGYENKTHTVLRFSRQYDTCDPRDLKITVGDAIYAARKEVRRTISCASPSCGAGHTKAREIYLARLSYTIFAEINAFVFHGGRLVEIYLQTGGKNLPAEIDFVFNLIQRRPT